MPSASPIKLKSGAWGAKTRESVTEGDTVTITTRSGKSWEARVRKVVWSGDGVSILETESLDGPPRRQRGGHASSYQTCENCHSGRGVVECTDSSGLQGLVCRRCAKDDRFALSFG